MYFLQHSGTYLHDCLICLASDGKAISMRIPHVHEFGHRRADETVRQQKQQPTSFEDGGVERRVWWPWCTGDGRHLYTSRPLTESDPHHHCTSSGCLDMYIYSYLIQLNTAVKRIRPVNSVRCSTGLMQLLDVSADLLPGPAANLLPAPNCSV